MHCYETIYILHPDLADEAVEAAKAKVEETIGGTGGRVYRRESWGKKRLAYTVAKQQRGFYQLIQYIGDGKANAELERLFRLDEAFIKYLTVKLRQDPATAEAKAQEAEARGEERSGRGDDRSGRGEDRFGRGDDRFGRGEDRFGRGDDRFGRGDDRPGRGRGRGRTESADEAEAPVSAED
jgi:small subunit ribosomal protein S6